VTELHLYLAIGIPTLAVLVGVLTNTMQMSSVNARIVLLETRVELSPERSSISITA